MKKTDIKILGFDKSFDVIHVMIMNYNPKEEIIKRYILNESMNEDIKRFNNVLNFFNMTLDKECRLFFDCSRKQASFFSRYYVDTIHENDFVEFEEFIEIVRQDKCLKEKVLTYYVEKYEDDNSFLNELLLSRRHGFSSELVEELTCLVLFFEQIREKLIYNMEKVGELLDREYRKHKEFLEKQRIENAADKIRFLNSDVSTWYGRQKEIQVRFAFVHQYAIWRGDFMKTGGMILGINYEKAFKAMWNLDVSVIDFCDALGDKVRFNIMQKIKENGGEMAVSDIARVTGISMPNVIYHVEKLKKVKLLTFIMKGKTAYYYVNPESIRIAINKLEKLMEE